MVWIAWAGCLAAIGVIVWFFGRNASRAEEPPRARPPGDWASGLDEDARMSFTEGLRAYHDKVAPLSVGAEHGVLTVYDPPRLISLYLLADRFAALGHDGLYDPEETVRELVTGCVGTEQPGVLHLRRTWPAGGMDRGAFAALVREIVCPDGAEGIVEWFADDGVGSLEVTVAGGTRGNIMLLDLARVADRYEQLCAERPGMPARALLRDVVFRLLAEDGPGLAWVKPPAERHRTILLAAGWPPTERRPAS